MQAEATDGKHAKGSALADPATTAKAATNGDLGLAGATGRADDPEPPGTPSPSGEHTPQLDGDATAPTAVSAAADVRAPPPPSSETAPHQDPAELKRLAELQVRRCAALAQASVGCLWDWAGAQTP